MPQGFTTYRFKVFLMALCLGLFIIPGSARAIDSNDPFVEAQSLIGGGKYLEAVSQYRNIIDSSDRISTKASALFFIAFIYDLYLDQPDRALKCYADLIRLYPQTPAASDALFNSGSILYKNDRYLEARKAFQAYVDRYPQGMRRQSAMAWAERAQQGIRVIPSRPEALPVLSALSPNVRILLARNKDKLVIDSDSRLSVSDLKSGRPLFNGEGPLVITLRQGMISVNAGKAVSRECMISASQDVLSLDGQRYRGALRVLVKPSGLLVVNHISIEDYLYGVVPKEMSWLWDPEALMAQAIASRTYALFIREKQGLIASDYDLEATTSSQVYGGVAVEKEQTTHAVNNTKGMVITFRGKLIISYFHANSGGYTESALNVWGVDIPYLKSVPDSFSTILPETVWDHRVSFKDLSNLFNQSHPNLGPIRKIKTGKTSRSGRILSFTLVSDKKQMTISGNNFRMTIGPRELKSTRFDIYPNHQGFFFKGTGYGHGVGMSQWGAHRMAQAGYSCKAIIKNYYPGTVITKVSYL
ncbi:MAG: SpoIID/LytB domain-containing protein [Proteobacteria bacterium]|nr:SpoIID/LytB domain-containing protein [Pseudomonadota bacterium]